MTASPCLRNCCLDENDICLGCFRSLSEIVAWNEMDAAKRRATLDHAEKRRQAFEVGRKKWSPMIL